MALSVDSIRDLPLPRLASRTMLGIGLGAVAALLVLFLTRPPATVPVLVAGEDLPAGTPLSELDVVVRDVEQADGLVIGDELGELATWVLGAPLADGEPLLASQLRPGVALSAPNTIAVELDAAHAVLGRLRGGDLVDVYATSAEPGRSTGATLIAGSLYVIEARLVESNAGPDRVELLLAVDDDTAKAITTAIHSGEVDLVRVGS